MYRLSLGSFVFSSHASDALSMPGKERSRCNASWYVFPFTRSLMLCCAALLSANVHVLERESTRVGVVVAGIALLIETCIVPNKLYPDPSFLYAWEVKSFVACCWSVISLYATPL